MGSSCDAWAHAICGRHPADFIQLASDSDLASRNLKLIYFLHLSLDGLTVSNWAFKSEGLALN